MPEQKFKAAKFLRNYSQYLSLVQDEVHVRRARVAMFWSLASFLYIIGFATVDEPANIGPVSVHGAAGKAFVFLFVATAYYVTRFGFSVVKIFALVNPLVLREEFKHYKKLGISEDMYITAAKKREIYEYIRLHTWINKNSVTVRKSDDLNAHDYEEKISLQTGYDILPHLDREDDVRDHNLRRPMLGWLENFVVLMYLPILLCGLGCAALLLAAVWFALSPDNLKDFGVSLLIFFAVRPSPTEKLIRKLWKTCKKCLPWNPP